MSKFDLGGIPLNGSTVRSAVNNSQSKINFNDPRSVYQATNGLGNCVVNFSDHLNINVPFYLPAWSYDTEDGISGEGVLTFMTFQGKTKVHHLYHDFSNGIYFYVIRHGKNNEHGYESKTRRQLTWALGGDTPNTYDSGLRPPNSLSSTDRYIDDATIGTDDDYEKKNDYPFKNACVVRVDNPHLNKIDYMNAVFPHYDNPLGDIVSANNADVSTFLNETVDDPEYTPNQDSEQHNSPKSGATQNPEVNK